MRHSQQNNLQQIENNKLRTSNNKLVWWNTMLIVVLSVMFLAGIVGVFLCNLP